MVVALPNSRVIEWNDRLNSGKRSENPGTRSLMTENNEQEIYLRPYLTGLWNKRYWLIGLCLLGVILGLAVSYLVAPTYEATALVASTLPRERIEFDSRIQTIADSQPLQAYPELAPPGCRRPSIPAGRSAGRLRG